MDAFATLSAEEREPYFQEAGARLGLPPHMVEKDFWVCWTLRRLFSLDRLRGHLLFKGGTSLSKAYGLIERFSEDIDLSIHRSSLGFEGETDPAHLKGRPFKRMNEALSEAARAKILHEIQPDLDGQIGELLGEKGWELRPDPTDPEGQSLAFVYPKSAVTQSATSYLRPEVKIEFGARADHEPSEQRPVRPYLAEAVPEALETPETDVKVISAIRTFWEKATILHQVAHRLLDKPFPERYSRHYCDLAAMIEAGPGADAMNEEELLSEVVTHKMTFYRSAPASYETAVKGTLKLVPPPERHQELAKDLASMQEMFFHKAPTLDSVMAILANRENGFNESGGTEP